MKKNNRKKKINKNKLIIIIGAAILLVIVVAGIAILAHKIDNKKKEEKKKEETAEKMDKQAVDTFYNNFLIAYILQGDVQTGNGTLTIEGDSNVYYAVTDPLLQNVHTVADIKEIINDSLIYYAAIRVDKLMNSAYANQYMSRDNTLYVKKTANICDVSPFGNLVKDNIEYAKRDDRHYVVYENVPYEINVDEDDNLRAGAMWFGCSRAVNYIDIDKESVYDPNKELDLGPDSEVENMENGEN